MALVINMTLIITFYSFGFPHNLYTLQKTRDEINLILFSPLSILCPTNWEWFFLKLSKYFTEKKKHLISSLLRTVHAFT